MEKRLMMFIAGLFLSMGVALAQTQVNGTVTSADDGEPVIGASVLVEGTKTGTVTDINGNFSISVPAGKKLVVSYLGMQTQTVNAKPGMRIELAADSQTLEDLVVVGYGTGRKVGTVIGSVSTVGSDKLKNAPSASVLDALQGNKVGAQDPVQGMRKSGGRACRIVCRFLCASARSRAEYCHAHIRPPSHSAARLGRRALYFNVLRGGYPKSQPAHLLPQAFPRAIFRALRTRFQKGKRDCFTVHSIQAYRAGYP